MRTKEELKYMMKFYQIKSMPIYRKDGTFMGKIYQDLSYCHRDARAYYTRDEYAINAACEQIDAYIDAVKRFISKDMLTISGRYIDDWNPRYNKDEEWHGTMDEIFEQFYKANNRLRYCNGCHHDFNDNEAGRLYRLWCRWIDEGRSFALYYGDGVVD